MQNEDSYLSKLRDLAVSAMEEMKAKDLAILDVDNTSSFTSVMIIASGTSSRHVKSIASNVVVEAKKAGMAPKGVEGENSGEWVLVDLGDVVVHIMLPDVRDFYQLEKLWTLPPETTADEG